MQNPKNVDINAIFEYPYFWEDGISSASDIYSIIPQTTAKIIPNIRSLMKGFKHKNAINAPRGSAIPDKKAYLNIVENLAKQYSIEMDLDELFTKAESFAIRHGGRSARTAKQFVELVKIGI